MFTKHSKKGVVTLLVVYVDDIFITKDKGNERNSSRKNLMNEFDIKNLGQIEYFFKIEIAHSFKGLNMFVIS